MKVYDFINADIAALAAALQPFLTAAPAPPGVTPPPPEPDDTVTVYPTGVRGVGKARRYPQPHPELGENEWGYATRLTEIINPSTGQSYIPRGIISSFEMAPSGYPFAEIVDRWLCPEDWWDQAEIDRQKRIGDDQAKGVPDAAGPYPVEAMLPIVEHGDDWRFLYWLDAYDPAKYGNCARKLLRGPQVEIARGLGWAHTNSNVFDPNTYNGPLQQVVLKVYGRA